MNYAKDITAEYTASYAKYVATSRAIVSLVDGLKPVNRRCINSADDLKLYHDKKFLKVAKLEGQVLGDYHPHGGASPVSLAQPFKIRYPLFEGQGNFGSPDNPNSVAASRYIECRLTKFCEDFYLATSEYADREDNYDGRLQEITQYYPPIPGSLLTGSSGIAVGLSTNIPPHMIKDVCSSLLSYIEEPTSDSYLKLLIPETCEESVILTPREEIEKLYRAGECSIRYKARTHYESIDGELALVVDAFPPDYRKKSLETSYILDAVESGNLELRNESKETVRYVFLSKNKEILKSVEERLVSSAGYRMYIEHRGKIKCYKLSEIYDDFISAKKHYIEVKYADLIQKNELEINFLDVLLRFKEDREYIKSIFDKSREQVIKDIMTKYATTQDIATRIISSTLASMMKDNSEKLLLKLEELKKSVSLYRTYLEDPMIKIILDVKTLYDEYKGEKRRAIHIDDLEDMITINYNNHDMKVSPSSLYYVATKDNKYERVHAAELLSMDLSDKIIVSSEFKYYVFHDNQGLISVSKETMENMDNKFKSGTLVSIIGTDNLEDLIIQRDKGKDIRLGAWSIRSRLSYIKQVEEGSIRIKLAQH